MTTAVRLSETSCFDVHEFDVGSRRRRDETVLSQTFQVKLDGLANQDQRFLASLADRHATRKVRNMSPVGGLAFFDDDDVVHC
jgi:hypothetical protein